MKSFRKLSSMAILLLAFVYPPSLAQAKDSSLINTLNEQSTETKTNVVEDKTRELMIAQRWDDRRRDDGRWDDRRRDDGRWDDRRRYRRERFLRRQYRREQYRRELYRRDRYRDQYDRRGPSIRLYL